jgi:hypothetical protein
MSAPLIGMPLSRSCFPARDRGGVSGHQHTSVAHGRRETGYRLSGFDAQAASRT